MKFLLIGLTLAAAFAQDATPPSQDTKPAAAAAQKPAAAPAAQQPAASAPAAQQPAASTPATPPAKTGVIWSGDVDLGFREMTGIGGDNQTYRTVVDLGDGVRIFDFNLNIESRTRKYFDKITLFGEGLGGDPETTVRLDAAKERLYDYYFNYRSINYFNYLPSFANPFLDQDILLTEQGSDVRRRFIDTELRLRPGTRIIPYLAFSHDSGSGSGITTFVAPGNEYPALTSLNDGTNRYRAGVSFEYSRFHLTLEEGGTTFKDDQTAWDTTQELGNRPNPVLGQTLYLNSLLQSYRARGDGTFSRALFTYSPYSWVDVTGQFLYSLPHTDTDYYQNDTGNFFDQSTAEFLLMEQAALTSSAEAPHSSGSLNVVLRPIKRVRVLEAWMTDRYHDASAAMLSDLTTLTPQALLTLSDDRLTMNYSREEVNGLVDAFRWLMLRGGYRYIWGDSTVRADPLVSPTPSESGALRQNVGLAGAEIRPFSKLRLNADLEIGRAGHSYFRTSLYNYEKGTVRARYQVLNSLQVTSTFTALYNNNPTPGVNFDLESHAASLGFFWTPKNSKHISVLGEYTRATMYTDVGYYLPSTQTPALSIYRENDHDATAMVELSPLSGKHAPRLSLGGSYFRSAGTRPEGYYQPLAKLSVPLGERVQLFSQWRWYSLTENYYIYEGFRTHIFETGLRFSH
jgi:hypothetical protein